MDACKYRYLDASAIVKLYVVEPQSDLVRAFFWSHPRPFQTTTLCFAEAMNVLKRKWLEGQKGRPGLSTQDYLKAVYALRVAAWGNEIAL